MQEPEHERLPNFDKRELQLPKADHFSPAKNAAARKFKSRFPDATIDFDGTTGSPKALLNRHGFLTGAPEAKKAVLPNGALVAQKVDGVRITKDFLRDQIALFGHGAEVLDGARIKRDFTSRNGLRTVIWEQRVNDIPVFEGLLVSHITGKGELASISSRFLPKADDAAVAEKINLQQPPVSAGQAIVFAARAIGERIAIRGIEFLGSSTSAEKRQQFQVAGLKGKTYAHLVWLPMSESVLKLCWEIILTDNQHGEMFRVLIDAKTGEALLRHSLTEYITPATYRVFTDDSPTPMSPGLATPSNTQPALVARQLVTLSALSTNASPAGWINDGGNETMGNNVDAHLDLNQNDKADLPRPQGSPFRVFDFPLNLANSPDTYRDAAVVQLFYWCNWMHDKLYDLGFDEAAGNFQVNNFDRGGNDGDPVQADAQDGGDSNNASFTSPPDGIEGRLQMFLFNGPDPYRDGSLDAEVVLHEYAHGLSNRRVGGGAGIYNLQSKGLGEGWSDFYALSLLSKPGDDVNGNYAMGAYAGRRFWGLVEENYYFGIRRYPYSTSLTNNPLSFKDIDPTQASPHSGVPVSPRAGGLVSEEHHVGEIWCSMLWEARANLIGKYGFSIGNQLILQIVTDALNLTPLNPTFVQARDAIILADQITSGGANFSELWSAFAKRGLGFSAVAPQSYTTTGVQEAFDLPDALSIPTTPFIFSGPVGGSFAPDFITITLTNIGTNTLNWTLSSASAWLDFSAMNGSLAVGAATNILVSPNLNALSLPVGIYTNVLVFSNQTSGLAQSRLFELHAGIPDFFTEWFDSGGNDLQNQSFTFIPDNSPGFYAVCRERVTAFPVNPVGGTTLYLDDDAFSTVRPTGGKKVSLYDQTNDVFYVGSNGYITFNNGDQTETETYTNHFNFPRISGLFTDLDASFPGATISWKQLADRIAVTYLHVPEYQQDNTNDFQIELFFDGTIRITYLRVDCQFGIAGLSRGTGIPVNFTESDFSSYLSCGMAISIPASATEGDGILSGQGNVVISTPLTNNLVVHLHSSDTSEITVPSSVTITAGQTNATFNLTVVNDSLLDGTRETQITASATGFNNSVGTMEVYDNETATLSLSVAGTVSETVGSVNATLSISAPPDEDVRVDLNSSAPTQLQVPTFVIIPAGQTSIVFSVVINNDTLIQGSRSVALTAQVIHWTGALVNITLLDDENAVLALTLPAQVQERDGTLTGAGQISIGGTLTTNLNVTLNSSPSGKLTFPNPLIIPAGQSVVMFNITVVDNSLAQGTQTVSVTATAGGFQSATNSILVKDDETPDAPENPSPSNLAMNVIASADLSWTQPDAAQGLTVYDIYFGTNGSLGAAEFLASTTNSPSFALPLLAPDTTYYWQVVSKRTVMTAGTVWQFTTRGVDHFTWDAIPVSQFIHAPIAVSITAKDNFERTVTSFSDVVNFSSPATSSFTPMSSAQFTNGVWAGNLVINEPLDNLVITASDNEWHMGNSPAFSVLLVNDIAVSVTGQMNLAVLNRDFNFTIMVTNIGPSSATGVVLTNLLPAGFEVQSVTLTQGSYTNLDGTVVFNLGTLTANTNVQITIVTQPTELGLFENQATISRNETDSFLGNNTVTTGIEVVLTAPPTLEFSTSGNNLVLSWPTNANGFVLEFTDTLTAPVTWSAVTNTPVVVSDHSVVTEEISSTTRFYRLHKPE